MDATIMPSTRSLISRLQDDYPTLTFQEGATFMWSPATRTVHYTDTSPALLLHELGHAICEHSDYATDLDLIKMERDAWQTAQQIALRYDVVIDEETLQQHLDTYREWLHARSRCPACGATGHQLKKQRYHCLACGEDWRVNEARLCGLKRYRMHSATKTPQ